jgi:hypothetical protein
MRFHGEVGLEAVLVTSAIFVHGAGVGIHRGDDAVTGGAPGDAPAAVAAITAVGRFNVLAGDQGQQTNRIGSGFA